MGNKPCTPGTSLNKYYDGTDSIASAGDTILFEEIVYIITNCVDNQLFGYPFDALYKSNIMDDIKPLQDISSVKLIMSFETIMICLGYYSLKRVDKWRDYLRVLYQSTRTCTKISTKAWQLRNNNSSSPSPPDPEPIFTIARVIPVNNMEDAVLAMQDEATTNIEVQCKVCLHNKICTINYPCSHAVLCKTCAHKLFIIAVTNNKQYINCPVCRSECAVKRLFI